MVLSRSFFLHLQRWIVSALPCFHAFAATMFDQWGSRWKTFVATLPVTVRPSDVRSMSKAISCYPPCQWISIFCGGIPSFCWKSKGELGWSSAEVNDTRNPSLCGDNEKKIHLPEIPPTLFLQAIVAYLFVSRRRCGEKTLAGLGNTTLVPIGSR